MKGASQNARLAKQLGFGKRHDGAARAASSRVQRASNKQMRIDIAEVVKKLDKYVIELQADRKEMLTKAAEPVKQLMKAKAPVYAGGYIRDRYEYKGVGKSRSAKGTGKKVASYLAGNLRGSIDIIPLQESIDIYVGPVFNKSGSTSGVFGENKFDPYYAWWIEYGTQHAKRRPFVRPAQAAFPQSLAILTNELSMLTARFNRENRITLPSQ